MCLVIDCCCISAVFDTSNAAHQDFKPVLDWIKNGVGRMVYGGETYKNELRVMRNFIPVLAQLERAGRIVVLPDGAVDEEERRLQKSVKDKKFNDAHLVAIVLVSQVRVVCTTDRGAATYLKRASLYPGGIRRPKIYKRRSHSNLLSDSNVVPICRSSG